MEITRDSMVDKLYTDMYFGNGKPAMTIRLAAVETSQERIESLLTTLIWLGVGTLTSTLGIIAVEVFKAVMK